MHAIDPEHWLYKKLPEEWLADADVEFNRGVDAWSVRNFPRALTRFRAAALCAIRAVLASRAEIDERFGKTAMSALKHLAEREDSSDEVREAARWLLSATPVGDSEYALKSAGEWHLLRRAPQTIIAYARGLLSQRA